MEYRIHQLNQFDSKSLQSLCEGEISNKNSWFQNIFNNYPLKPVLHIFIKKESVDMSGIFASIQLRENDILVKEKGSHSSVIVNSVLNKLCIKIKKQVQTERKIYLENRKKQIFHVANSFYFRLKEHAANNDQEEFVKLARQVFPEVKWYVEHFIGGKAHLNDYIKSNPGNADHVIYQVYIHLFTQLQKDHFSPLNIIIWALVLTEAKLVSLENDFANKISEGIGEDITRVSGWQFSDGAQLEQSVIEPYTFEADDPEQKYFKPGEYYIDEILEDAGVELIFDSNEEIRHLDVAAFIENVSFPGRYVFVMHYLGRYSSEEISCIMQIDQDGVEKLLGETRGLLIGFLKQAHAVTI